ALAINATSYATGQAVTFFDGTNDHVTWKRTRRRGERARITIAHLMASTAIPFIFPAARVGDDFCMDGSVRQITPLSPALHLGARRLVGIAVGQFFGQRADATPIEPQYPSFAQIAGHALSSIFLDNLGADLERLTQMNRLLALLPTARLERSGLVLPHADPIVLPPSTDTGTRALKYRDGFLAAQRPVLRAS